MSYALDIADAFWANGTRTLDGAVAGAPGLNFADQAGYAAWVRTPRTLSGKTWQIMPGETSKDLFISPLVPEDGGREFRCVATNPLGSTTSNAGKIIIITP